VFATEFGPDEVAALGKQVAWLPHGVIVTFADGYKRVLNPSDIVEYGVA
jgi:hypothetical protein